MRNTQYTIRNTQYRSAFTIAELLLALAITGLLLAVTAMAFHASVINYGENEDIFKTINNARQALSRITSQLRTANAVDPCAPDNECSFFTADGNDDITYQYYDSDNTLYLIDNSTAISYVLCNNVTAMTFTKDIAVEDTTIYVKSVQISMTVASGNTQRTVSAAAVVRRNLK
jgi:uncharacterized membrane protein